MARRDDLYSKAAPQAGTSDIDGSRSHDRAFCWSVSDGANQSWPLTGAAGSVGYSLLDVEAPQGEDILSEMGRSGTVRVSKSGFIVSVVDVLTVCSDLKRQKPHGVSREASVNGEREVRGTFRIRQFRQWHIRDSEARDLYIHR